MTPHDAHRGAPAQRRKNGEVSCRRERLRATPHAGSAGVKLGTLDMPDDPRGKQDPRGDDFRHAATMPTGDVRAEIDRDHTAASGTEAASHPVIIRRGTGGATEELPSVDPQRYVIEREIARGGMGRIMAAQDRRLGRPVAIKELLADSPALRARFEREARITARLQHPAIVNVLEAGTWPGGEPLYIMKLIAGRSLDRVLGHRSEEERLALLPSVIAVVDALAYAHSHRVIHRDLKPGNVLIGEFGETVVIDWGLAKNLDDAGDVDAPTSNTSSEEPATSGLTIAGDVMGTPAYMPPEQARGEALDERADVYALGAILYHVLTGIAPYPGHTAEQVLAAVLAGPPRPIDTLTPGMPRDLVAIVGKAMAYAAADRYPSARQLAEDLKKFQTGKLVGAHRYSRWQLLRRWIRRHRAAVAVGTAAAAVLAVVGIVAVRRVVDEQVRTDQKRRDAEDIMAFMLNDLRKKLAPVGKLELLDDVANKAVRYYDEREDRLSDADRAGRVSAMHDLGDVLAARGHTDDALREYRAASTIAQSLANGSPGNAELQSLLAASHSRIGETLEAIGDRAGALPEECEGIATAELSLWLDPADPRRLRAVEDAQASLATFYFHENNAEAALVILRSNVMIAELLAVRDPANMERQRDLAVARENLGLALFAKGDLVLAAEEFHRAMDTAQRLATLDPTNAQAQSDLASLHDRLGTVLRAQGHVPGALEEYRQEITIARQLAARDPSNVQPQRVLALAHDRMADVMLDQGDLAAALAEQREALSILQIQVAADPKNADLQHQLWSGHLRMGDVLVGQGEWSPALSEYQLAIAIAKRHMDEDPEDVSRVRDLGICHDKVGDALLARGDRAGALAEYREWNAIATKLAAINGNSDARHDLAISSAKLGGALLKTGEFDGALKELHQSVAIFAELVAQDHTNSDRMRELAAARSKLGEALLGQGDARAALSEIDAAMAIAKPIADADPTNLADQEDVASIYQDLGDAHLARGDATAARADYAAALVLAKRLIDRDPTDADARELVTSLTRKLKAR
jgi:tetratricopeptide (TPR) repeat protein